MWEVSGVVQTDQLRSAFWEQCGSRFVCEAQPMCLMMYGQSSKRCSRSRPAKWLLRGPYPDHPRPRSAFAHEGYLNAQCAEERLRAAQSAGERAGIFWPARVSPGSIVRSIGTEANKI
jgi:hypothetical protein